MVVNPCHLIRSAIFYISEISAPENLLELFASVFQDDATYTNHKLVSDEMCIYRTILITASFRAMLGSNNFGKTFSWTLHSSEAVRFTILKIPMNAHLFVLPSRALSRSPSSDTIPSFIQICFWCLSSHPENNFSQE